MTNTPQRIFDLEQVRLHRLRAGNMAADFDFMRVEIADRMLDRLQDVNRTFETILDMGGDMGRFMPPKSSTVNMETAAYADTPLDIPPERYDLVLSNLGMHWINDLPGLLIQLNSALKPDGLMLASLYGGETLKELRHAFLSAEAEITGGANARVIPFAEVKDLGSLLQRAGFALPVTDTDTITVTYEHPLKLMHDLRGMGETNALVGRSKTFLRRDVLMRACEIYQQAHGLENGRVPATFQIMYLTGWHPHESQQKPLKPGSAKISLAEALKRAPAPQKPNE